MDNIRSERISRGVFKVEVVHEPFTFRYNLKGGFFSSEKNARKTADTLAWTSRHLFRAAAVIRTAIIEPPLPESLKSVGERRQTWLKNALILEEAAMMVPQKLNDFSTGSNGITISMLDAAFGFADKVIAFATVNAPGTYTDDKSFIARWCNYCLDTGLPERANILRNRMHNTPALVGVAEDKDEQLREYALRIGTQHIPSRVPVIKAPPPVIRGDRARSLVSLITPQLIEKLATLPAGAEKEELMGRVKAITSRVDDAAQRRSAARTIEDVRLSLDVLEQQVDTRIEAADSAAGIVQHHETETPGM